MQDTVLELTKRCFFEFRDYLVKNVPQKVTVANACFVVNEYVSEGEKRHLTPEKIVKLEKQRASEPLFYIDLVKTKDDEFGFSINPKKFVQMIKSLLERPFDDLGKIPDLEPKILSDLYKAIKNEAYIKAPIKPTQEPIDPDPNSLPRKLPD